MINFRFLSLSSKQGILTGPNRKSGSCMIIRQRPSLLIPI